MVTELQSLKYRTIWSRQKVNGKLTTGGSANTFLDNITSNRSTNSSIVVGAWKKTQNVNYPLWKFTTIHKCNFINIQ